MRLGKRTALGGPAATVATGARAASEEQEIARWNRLANAANIQLE